MGRSLDDAITGFFARAADDATLAGLIGAASPGGVRIAYGWPQDVLEAPKASLFPRVTYYRTGGGEIVRPSNGRVTLRLDLWVWPEGVNGGMGRLTSIDDRLLMLFDEQHWTTEAARLYAVASDAQDFPSGPGTPLRRMRPLDVYVSPV